MPGKAFYMVTFDLQNSAGRSDDYRHAESSLKFRFGPDNYWKLVKQCAIVRTDQGARSIRDALGQRLGADCNILVVKLARGYAFKIRDHAKRRAARQCLRQIGTDTGRDDFEDLL